MSTNGSVCDTLLDDDALASLADLERSRSDRVKRARSSMRVRIKTKVIAQPGNSADRLKLKVQGVTGDISAGGCQVLFPVPLRVGDIYWLTFDKSETDLNPAFGRCLRCRLIREDAYEAGFKFLQPIDMSDVAQSDNIEDLIR